MTWWESLIPYLVVLAMGCAILGVAWLEWVLEEPPLPPLHPAQPELSGCRCGCSAEAECHALASGTTD